MKIENNPMQRENQAFYPFLQSPRCGAKTRSGNACQAPAVREKKRCRMHGGTYGAGAPVGSQNALKHGFSTREIKTLRKSVKKYLKITSDVTP